MILNYWGRFESTVEDYWEMFFNPRFSAYLIVRIADKTALNPGADTWKPLEPWNPGTLEIICQTNNLALLLLDGMLDSREGK